MKKINILAHRGLWDTVENKNSLLSLEKALLNEFGIETDIRDYKKNIVISHDVPDEQTVELESLLKQYNDSNVFLALNIKSDGIMSLSKTILEQYNIKNYFFFDMSVPEMYQCMKSKYQFFTRQSEFEKEPLFYKESMGVWMDEFHDEWIDERNILYHLQNNKKVGIISPELHGRQKEEKWKLYKTFNDSLSKEYRDKLFLCTDKPLEARKYFYEE